MSTYYDVKIESEVFDKSYELKRRNFLGIIEKIPHKKRVMEIGPGAGSMIKICQEAGFKEFLLIDNDSGVAEHVGSLFGLPVVVAEDLVFELTKVQNNSIDLAIFCHVIEHIPIEIIKIVLSSVREKLSSNGLLLIEMPNIACPVGGLENFYSDSTHRTPMTSAALVQALQLAGYGLIEAHPFRPGQGPRFLMGKLRYGLNIVLGNIRNFLSGTKVLRSPSYFVVASVS